jgi:hypothetical protein
MGRTVVIGVMGVGAIMSHGGFTAMAVICIMALICIMAVTSATDGCRSLGVALLGWHVGCIPR